MMRITEKDIVGMFNRIKQEIGVEINRANYSRSLYLIANAAVWGYFYNFQYTDDDIERYIQKLSDHYKETLNLASQSPSSDRVLLVTSRISDNHELIRQYARALAICGKTSKIIVLGNRLLKTKCSNPSL